MLIKNKLLMGALALAVLPVLATAGILGWLSYTAGKRSIELESQQKLIALRENKAAQIEDYFEFIRKQIITLAEDKMTVDAMQAYTKSFAQFKNDSETDIESARSELAKYYRKEFGAEYENRNLFPTDRMNTIFNQLSDDAVAFQYQYIKNNSHPLGSKDKLDSSSKNTEYDNIHQRYHSIFRHYLHEFSYYDIFLVDLAQGEVVYSVFKELDFATSLINGPYRNSGLAQAFKAGARLNSRNQTALIDFAPYFPSYEDPASFISAPIFDNGVKVGVLIFQMPIDRINKIMTSGQDWNAKGYGASGETYLVGADGLMRSQSRFLIEDKVNYLTALEGAKLDSNIIKKIDKKNTAIGLQPVNTPGVKAALTGESGFQIFPDYRNIPVLSAYKPLKINGLDWVLMSEIDEEEAFASSRDLASNIFYTTTILVVVTCILAIILGMFFARNISNPITKIVASMRDIAEGDGDLTVRLNASRKDEIGQLAMCFNLFVEKVEKLVQNISQSAINVSTSAEELSAITAEVRQNIQHQKSDTDQVATAMSQMASSVQEVASNVNHSLDSIQAVDKDTQEAKAVSVQSKESIDTLVENISDASGAIQSLASQNEDVTLVLDVIKGIAEQTNLLALNAAIEAARAGEQGRGFAVVADEVRTLANRTHTSAQEIEEMLDKLQRGTHDCVAIMQSASELAMNSISQVDSSVSYLQEIATQTPTVADMSMQIASSTEEQSLVASEVNQSIVNINQLTVKSAEAVEQVAVASHELTNLSAQLNQQLNQFKVG